MDLIDLTRMTADDALIHIDTHAVRQRYSTRHNWFVTLLYVGGEHVMRNEATGGEHTLNAEYTDAPRLIAHWTQFCRQNGVDR